MKKAIVFSLMMLSIQLLGCDTAEVQITNELTFNEILIEGESYSLEQIKVIACLDYEKLFINESRLGYMLRSCEGTSEEYGYISLIFDPYINISSLEGKVGMSFEINGLYEEGTEMEGMAISGLKNRHLLVDSFIEVSVASHGKVQ